jgi:hypothetical protein
MRSVRATCTIKSTGELVQLCNEGWLDSSGDIQVAAECDKDPVFRVAVYYGNPTVIAPDGSSNPLHAGQLLTYDFTTKAIGVTEAGFTSQQRDLFDEQSRQLGWTTPTDASSPPSEAPPTSISPPTMTGAMQTDSAADPGKWGGTPAPTFTYQWQSCPDGTAASCIDVPNETGQTISSAKRPCFVRVSVTATNTSGSARADSGIFQYCIA